MAEAGGSSTDPASGSAIGRPRFWLAAALITAILFLIYWFFVRAVFVPVLVNLDPQDASDVAKVLEAKTITYRFDDQGRTIAVESSQADKARIELAGSELPMKGQIGFELFNQSDMGLTEFAQKVNYQRALQGELARTILLLDGIESVRVHLGLPERGLFRGDQALPKASVTLILKPGKALSAATVSGIQRMVSGAVPDLPGDAVAVLDGTGRIVSTDALPVVAADSASDDLVRSQRERLTAAIIRALPDLRFSVNLSLRYLQAPGRIETSESTSQADQVPKARATPRGIPDYSYVIRITTPDALDDGRRSDVQRLSGEAIGFEPARGDVLAFVVGPVLAEPVVAPAPTEERIVARSAPPPAAPSEFDWRNWWPLLLLIALAAVATAVWNDRRRRHRQRSGELTSFAEELRQRLDLETAS